MIDAVPQHTPCTTCTLSETGYDAGKTVSAVVQEVLSLCIKDRAHLRTRLRMMSSRDSRSRAKSVAASSS